MHEARKTVTLLFADVVASTELGARLDPEAVRQVMARYFAEMAEIVTQHGGTVEKFIGDEVMAVFGVPSIHEDDALRAVRAAAAMRERLRELNVELEERWGSRLEIRIGVNTGQVVAGDHTAGHGFVTGDAVNLAKRIEQAAAPGEILLGEATARIVGHAVETTPAQPFTAKGKADEVHAERLERVDPTSEALPRRLDAPLVGREDEVAALEAAYARAVETRRPQLLTVYGLPGIGKSRLARELVVRVQGEARLLVGRCVPYGDGITFWPVREILPDESFEGAREEIFWRVRKRLEALAGDRPLVVCFDDVHWAEPTFLDLVQYLAGWMQDTPVLILCLARAELFDKRPDWPRDEPDATSLPLGPLDEGESGELLELLGTHESARDRIARAAEGNPLFVEQMAAIAAEEGAEVTVPPSIQAVLAARLDALERDEGGILECAAVVGRDFSLRAVLELVPERLRPRVSPLLLGLMRQELVRPRAVGDEDGFRFRHALIRDAAYERMPKALRAELHERHANHLETSYPEDVLVGYHLEQAVLLRRELGPQDDALRALAARAASTLQGLGRKAYARGDAPASASLLDRAAAILDPSDRQRPALLVELADALMPLGQFARVEQTLYEATAEAGRSGDRRSELRAAIGLRFLRVFMPAEHAEAAAPPDAQIIEELEALDDDLGLARAWRVFSEDHAGACRWEARADALERALVHARRLRARRSEASAIAALLVQALHFGPMPGSRVVSRCRDLLAAADQDLPLQAGLKATLAAALATQGQLDEARAIYADSAAIHDELGLRVRRAVGTLFGAEIEMLADDPAAAENELLRGYQTLEAMGETGVRSVLAAYLAEALWRQGRADEASVYAEIAAEIADPGDVAAQTLQRVTMARALVERGATDSAEAVAQEAVELAGGTDFLALQAAAALSLADVLVESGRDEEARQHFERARPLYERKENVVAAERLSERLSHLAPRA